MAAPPNFEEGQSTYRPPRFNGQYYGWWKTRMHDFIMAEDSELWDVICDGPYVPTKKVGEPAVMVPKTRKEYNDADRKAVEKNFRAKKILVCDIGPDEYNRISACQSAKEIWEALQMAHEGTTQVKQSKIDMLTTEYELFKMKDDKSIQDMHTRFTSIINELHSLGEIIPRNKLVRKVLSVLPSSWESKVNAITEAKDLQTLTMDELEKNPVLKAENNDSSEEDSDMAYLTRRFQKMVRRNGGIPKRGSSSKPKNYDLYHKCGKPEHFIKDCPLLKQEHFKHNSDKVAKRNPVPDKCFKRKNEADNIVKQALAAWGDSSSESEEENDAGDSSMLAVKSEANEYDSIFALMAQSDDDEDDDNDEDALTIKLGDAEQTRDDLVVCVVDLKETIENLKNEKEVLTEKIASVEHERDDLMVVVVDLKETTENLSKEKNALVEKVAITEQERDDLLVVIADLDLCAELEKNRQLQAELEKVQNDLEKSLKWTRSSYAITAMYFNNCGNRQRIGFQREKVPYNPHRKNNGHFKENCQARVQSVQKNKVFAEKGTMRGSSQQWIMDSGCSKHMTGNTMDFLSLKALQGGNVSFVNGKKGLLSVSQICDKGNKMQFLSKICTVTNLVTGEVKARTCKLLSSEQVDIEGPSLWLAKFKEHKVCDACAIGNHVKSSFKPKNNFFRTKDETFEVFVAFLKKIQVKMESKVGYIISDHGTEFDNAKFDEFCSENGITHNFSAPRTPQQLA
ncbi:uncharacterized protein LOC107810242 [Nicotiana tabacum]|uniref:Uncharacterized protein LOC107810242 n=1 Tax=Nicotiana tabacum TaxID=4097 RepID=A0AC58SMZ4_TOBAC